MTLRLLPHVLAFLIGTPAFAAAAEKKGASSGKLAGAEGTVEFGLRGQLDLDKDDDTVAYAELTLGYFLFQGFELGLSSLQGTTPSGARDQHGLFIEYDFVNSTQFLPYFGGAMKHAAAPTGSEDQRDARLGTVYVGTALVVAPNAALALTVKVDYSNEKLFGPVDDRKRRNREANLGLRLYF